MLIKEKIDEEKEKKLDILKDDYVETQTAVSELRKSGKDTTMAELLLLDMPAKIEMARKSYEQHDIDRARKVIDEIKYDIKKTL